MRYRDSPVVFLVFQLFHYIISSSASEGFDQIKMLLIIEALLLISAALEQVSLYSSMNIIDMKTDIYDSHRATELLLKD